MRALDLEGLLPIDARMCEGPEAHIVSYPRAQWALGLILLCAPGVRDKDVPNMGDRTSMGSKLYQLVPESPLHANDILSHEEAS